VKRALVKYDVPQDVFAQLVGVNAPRVSKYLSGLVTITPAAELRMEIAVKFIEWIADRCAPFPVCFHDVLRIEQLWAEFQATYDGMNGEARTAETRAAAQA
jgi:hypothetical protein